MQTWLMQQYGGVWDDFYPRCDEDTQIVIDRRYAALREKGNLSRRPISEHLEDGIFELRANAARLLFFFGNRRNIVFVHGIIKKQSKVPRADIELAKNRRAEILAGQVSANAVPN